MYYYIQFYKICWIRKKFAQSQYDANIRQGHTKIYLNNPSIKIIENVIPRCPMPDVAVHSFNEF